MHSKWVLIRCLQTFEYKFSFSFEIVDGLTTSTCTKSLTNKTVINKKLISNNFTNLHLEKKLRECKKKVHESFLSTIFTWISLVFVILKSKFANKKISVLLRKLYCQPKCSHSTEFLPECFCNVKKSRNFPLKLEGKLFCVSFMYLLFASSLVQICRA